MVHYDSISKQNFNDVLKGVICKYHFADEDVIIVGIYFGVLEVKATALT